MSHRDKTISRQSLRWLEDVLCQLGAAMIHDWHTKRNWTLSKLV